MKKYVILKVMCINCEHSHLYHNESFKDGRCLMCYCRLTDKANLLYYKQVCKNFKQKTDEKDK